MGTIKLQNIRTFSYHGCLPQEGRIGSDYRVDIEVEANLVPSAISDELTDTVDYVHLNAIVKEEMAIRAKLLETVAQRILQRIAAELPLVSFAKVAVAKLNPPIGGDVASVAIEMEWRKGS
jgi:dihydroneopterin aldolase